MASASTSADLISVLSEGTFEEHVVDLAAFLSRSLAESQRSDSIAALQSAAAEAQDDAAKKQAVLIDVVAKVKGLGEGTDRELEGAYNLLTVLISQTLSDEAERAKLLASLCAAVASDANSERSAIRYRILANIFNSLPVSSSLRFTVFSHLLDIASAADELEYLTDALSSVPRWLATWGVADSHKAELLDKIASKLEASEQPIQALDFRLTYLRFLSSSSVDSSSTKASAEKAVASSLLLSRSWEFESLLQISAVQALKGSPVFDLLKVFVSGTAAEYKKWEASNGAEISRLGLDAAELDRKIRLLDLAGLCSRSVSAEVSYKQIADVLNVDLADVERWVIDVIRAGLVSGKLSQVNQSFRIYRSTYRTFGQEQWKTLEARLVQWQGSIENILQTLDAARAPGAGAGGAKGEKGQLKDEQDKGAESQQQQQPQQQQIAA